MKILKIACVAAVLLVSTGEGCQKAEKTGSSGEAEAMLSLPGQVSGQVQGETVVTLMTYNVGAFRKSIDELGRFSFKEVSGVIKSAGAEIVGLNETDWGGARTLGEKQARKLARTLGVLWSSSFFPAGYSWYGNAIVWDKRRWGAGTVHERLVLDKTDGSEVRSMGAIEFPRFVFCTTHLDHVSESDRFNAVDKITAWAEENYSSTGKPVFLAGDMNALPSSETIVRLRENWVLLSTEDFTYPADEPKKCIDFVFVYRNGGENIVELLGGGVLTAEDLPDVHVASDHCPVWVKVRLL